MEQYKIQKRLGDGTYGCVYKATNINSGQIVAIKKFKKKYNSWDECLNLREIKALQKLKHHNIIKLLEVFKEKDELNLVFEFLDRDIYQAYLENKNNGKSISEDKIRTIIKQVAEGLAYMHRIGYFHRDLKPENLLVAGETVKICDFGLAREVRSRPPYTDYVATRWYRAPEILLKQTNYNSPVDIFALGCIMAELYTLNPLFNGSSELDQIFKLCQVLGTPNIKEWPECQKLASASNITFPNYQAVPLERIIQTASPEALDLIRDMLKYDPTKRPTAKQILEYPYFTQHQTVNIPYSFQDKGERIDKIEKPDKLERIERIERIERQDKQEKSQKYDNHPPLELPKIGKENKQKMNDTHTYLMDLEQKILEYEKPVKKEELQRNSFHKQLIDKKPTFEQPQDKEYPLLEQRIESKKQKGNAFKLLKYNDPIAEQLAQQQIYQSRSYEPTKRKIYEFQLPNVPALKSNFPHKLELLPPKQFPITNLQQNYPRSMNPPLGYKFQPQTDFNRQNKLYSNY